jgi:lipoprotein-anchoring transpeptidase ErfK/SrfK
VSRSSGRPHEPAAPAAQQAAGLHRLTGLRAGRDPRLAPELVLHSDLLEEVIVSPTRNAAVRLMAAVTVSASCAAVAHPAHSDARTPRAGKATQRLVILKRRHAAFARPNRDSTWLGPARSRRPITGVRTRLPVLGETTDARGRPWLHVRLSGRPNSHTGWISGRYTRAAVTPWRLRIDTSRRRVKVFRSGRVVRSFRVVVGKPSTPTPHGHFFVEEPVQLSSGMIGAPYALALSARSNVFQEFEGGPGQIALHGLGGVGGVPGTAASHGCIRLSRRHITWLAARIGPGVPVRIVG